jgi:hypothetical protein
VCLAKTPSGCKMSLLLEFGGRFESSLRPGTSSSLAEQVPAAAADSTLGDTVLRWTSEAGSLGLNVEALHCFDYFATEACTTIKDQVSQGRVEGKCFAHLNDPRAGWMLPARLNSMPREPRPIQLEPRSVPANNSLRLDEDQWINA